MKRPLKIFFIIFLFIGACNGEQEKEISAQDFQSGDICSFVNDSTSFGILKILSIEDSTFHVKFYRNTYPQRPVQIVMSELTIEPDTANLKFGISHLAVMKNSFLHWHPEVILNEKVSMEELVPYDKWKDAQINDQ